MTTYTIKLLAILAMIVDHIGAIFFPQVVVLRVIGRFSFPLFAWLIANGAVHTHNTSKYFVRLLIFAALSQIPYQLAFDISSLSMNIFFTLSFGLGCIMLYSAPISRILKALGIFGLLILGFALQVNYGVFGILSILFFYIYFTDLPKQILSQILIFTSFTFIPIFFSHPSNILNLSLLGVSQILAPFSILITSHYNGKKGPSAKYISYLFYPVHLLILYVLKILI